MRYLGTFEFDQFKLLNLTPIIHSLNLKAYPQSMLYIQPYLHHIITPTLLNQSYAQSWKHQPITMITIGTQRKSMVGLAGLQQTSLTLDTVTSNEYHCFSVLASIHSMSSISICCRPLCWPSKSSTSKQ